MVTVFEESGVILYRVQFFLFAGFQILTIPLFSLHTHSACLLRPSHHSGCQSKQRIKRRVSKGLFFLFTSFLISFLGFLRFLFHDLRILEKGNHVYGFLWPLFFPLSEHAISWMVLFFLEFLKGCFSFLVFHCKKIRFLLFDL